MFHREMFETARTLLPIGVALLAIVALIAGCVATAMIGWQKLQIAKLRKDYYGLLKEIAHAVQNYRDCAESKGRVLDERDRAWKDIRCLQGALDIATEALKNRHRDVSNFFTEAKEVDQILGKALGYPPYFPDVSQVDDGSVCTGEHTLVSLAEEAAARIAVISGGVYLIACERRRQVNVEGWSAAHDDGHSHGELAASAAAYALQRTPAAWIADIPAKVDACRLKPKDPIRNLVCAGALIAAEIDRIYRAEEKRIARTAVAPEVEAISANPDQIPDFWLDPVCLDFEGCLPWVILLMCSGLEPSTSSARRVIAMGGVWMKRPGVSAPLSVNAPLSVDLTTYAATIEDGMIVGVGSRKAVRIRVSPPPGVVETAATTATEVTS